MNPLGLLFLFLLCANIYGQEVCSAMSASYSEWGEYCLNNTFETTRTYSIGYEVREMFWIPSETFTREIKGQGECWLGIMQCNPTFNASNTTGASSHRFTVSRWSYAIGSFLGVPYCYPTTMYEIPDPIERPVVLCPLACG